MYKNTQPNRTVYREDHANQESGIGSRWTKLSRRNDTKRHIPGGGTITINICNSNDATQLHPQKIHCRMQIQKQINHLMYMDGIKILPKKKIGDPETKCENMQSRYRNRIWHRIMRHASNEKVASDT